MNYNQVLHKIKKYTLSLPYVSSAHIGDIYEYLNGNLNVIYATTNIDITESTRNDNLTSYNVYLYYVDRLTQDKSNHIEIKTTAEQVLNSIVNYASTIGDITDGWTIRFFEQQFTDYCAGGYVQFQLDVPNLMGNCIIDKYEDEGIDPNVPEYSIIDDNIIVSNKTWSSFKINEIVTDLSTNINNCDVRISDLETTVNNLDTSVSDLNNRIETVEGELDNLGDFTCGTIEPTTTNFVEGTSYTIHEALQRTANLFEGYQGEIDDINDLIPNQATTQNQLADKAFVNSTVATNAANFRGNWSKWGDVPTDTSRYPEDYVGNRTPTNNDYLVVQDASDYISPEVKAHMLTVVNLHATKHFTIGVTDEYGAYREYYYNDGFARTWKSISNEYSLKYSSGNPGEWYIKTNKPEYTYIIKDETSYSNANDGILLCKTNDSTVPVIIGIPPQVGQYQGSWRFIYVGDWTTNGKNGWKPQYQIGSSFTAEQQAAIDSTITANKVATYDGYGTKITALQTDKLDKNYTANKIYGTDSLGAQTVYTLGDGLAFDNGQIKCTRTTAAWGNITGTLSNQTDLQNALDSKQDTLTAGEGIEISGNTISATPSDNATNDDIDFMFVTEIKLIREQTDDENYIDWLVNTNGETMEYNGQTYYKWVSWANDDNNNGSWTLIEHPNIIVLTNTLDVQLPFNTNSPEFEYWITIDDEGGMGVNNYIHGDYTKKTFQ